MTPSTADPSGVNGGASVCRRALIDCAQVMYCMYPVYMLPSNAAGRTTRGRTAYSPEAGRDGW